MPRRSTVTLMLAALLAGGARAQMDQNRRECCRSWGEPVSGQLDAHGAGTLQFKTNSLSVEIAFLDGVAQRAVYRASPMDAVMVDRCLYANSQDSQWHAWNPPGQPATRETHQWIRADEMAMAQLTSGVLTVTGPRWNLHLTEPPSDATVTNQGIGTVTNSESAPQELSNREDAMELEHIAAQPASKPAAPAVLPAQGDSKEGALRQVGPPNGTMRSGGREVLLYPWGNIWIRDGKVVALD